VRRVAIALLLVASACSSSTTGPAPTTVPIATTATPTTAPTETIAPTSLVTTLVQPTTTIPEFPSGDRPCGTLAEPPATYDHVIWIWMENHSAAQVIGRPDAPFVTDLAAKCATANDYRSVGKPSLPNYIGATSGDTWGITDDAGPATHRLTVDNLFRQVRAAGGTAISYQDAMPANCVLGGRSTYAVKHNPAAYYAGGDDRSACITDDVPFAPNFLNAMSSGTLPTFSFVTPDLCNDTHDCPVATGDNWLSGVLSVLLDMPVYHAGRTAIFLVWDEDAPMPFVAITPSVHPGTVLTQTVDHYALLRTTEEMLGITTYLGKAATASSMRPALHA
jgi:hypothetical protein